VNQGEVYWADLQEPAGSEPGYRRPCVVIQSNLLNHSRFGTAVVCLLTSNLRQARMPGNVLLDAGEGGLPRRSVVLVAQIITVNKSQLTEKMGTLPIRRVNQILEGVIFVLTPREGLGEW